MQNRFKTIDPILEIHETWDYVQVLFQHVGMAETAYRQRAIGLTHATRYPWTSRNMSPQGSTFKASSNVQKLRELR